MARAMATDPFQNFRFHVTVTKAGTIEPLGPTTAGFTTCSIPGMNVEVAEYKEGTMVFRRKYPGDVTFDDVTLARGVMKNDSDFYTWANNMKTGQEYRVDLTIKQFHRKDVSGAADFSALTPSRTILCSECLPTTVKFGSDLDSQSSDVSVQELTIGTEQVTVTNSLA